MDDIQFRQLLNYLDFSWPGYRKVRKGVKKRITRHMQALGCHTMTDYLIELETDPEAEAECKRLMTVSISRFFRDRGLWQTLRNDILPELIQIEKETLRVWSAGCASGEEAYSFQILWEEMKKRCAVLPGLELMATDMNPEYLDRCRTGIYPRSNLREVPEDLRALWFEIRKGGRQYRVRASLRENIIWQEHNLFDEPPGSDFHIIFLRNNLLTYYNPPLKEAAFRKIAASLRPRGYLVIGSHERLPFSSESLIRHGSCPYFHRKKD